MEKKSCVTPAGTSTSLTSRINGKTTHTQSVNSLPIWEEAQRHTVLLHLTCCHVDTVQCTPNTQHSRSLHLNMFYTKRDIGVRFFFFLKSVRRNVWLVSGNQVRLPLDRDIVMFIGAPLPSVPVLFIVVSLWEPTKSTLHRRRWGSLPTMHILSRKISA